jgi:hypothetical protein
MAGAAHAVTVKQEGAEWRQNYMWGVCVMAKQKRLATLCSGFRTPVWGPCMHACMQAMHACRRAAAAPRHLLLQRGALGGQALLQLRLHRVAGHRGRHARLHRLRHAPRRLLLYQRRLQLRAPPARSVCPAQNVRCRSRSSQPSPMHPAG